MTDEMPDTIIMKWCVPGGWYVCNRNMHTYKGQADESGNVVMHRLPDCEDRIN